MNKHAKTPSNWGTLSLEGENFYHNLAKKLFEKLGKEKENDIIIWFIKENVNFVYSKEGKDADASVKEVQTTILDFLEEVFYEDQEDFILDTWHEHFYK